MIKVALTGNIGSGKTTIANIFKVFGVPVFNADIEARSLYLDKDVKNKLRLLFKEEVFLSSGEVDTKALASIIFNDKEALKDVNNIIHPLVLSMYNNWCVNNSIAPYTIHETAILFENSLQDNFDFVINVSASVEVRVSRVMERDGVPKSLVEERMANQLSDEIKCELSQFIINNDGNRFLIPQVDRIHKNLLSK
ncbi:MAG: dephospho-CoA kinase [Bacteroidota bacterium]